MTSTDKIIFTSALASLLTIFAVAPVPGTEPLKAAVSQNEMTDKLEGLGIKCLIRLGAKTSIYVDSVRMGSKAFYKGVAVGDLIKGLVQKGDDTFYLNIERDGKPYQIIFKGIAQKPSPDAMPQAVTNAGTDKHSVPELPVLPKDTPAPDKPPREKALLKYDIEILIDISGSMNDADGTGGVSKFKWCHSQIRDLSRRLEPYKRSLTITTFNQGYETEENCSAERVESIFSATAPHGGTDLLDPLEAALERAKSIVNRGTAQSQKRALVAVITDGMPNIPTDPNDVNKLLASFTKGLLDPDQVVVVFLQVGDNFNGESFCRSLDKDLLSEGAKYDIVETETFSQLKSKGLANALVDAIVDTMAAHANSGKGQRPYGGSRETTIDELRKERERIEKKLLGND